MQLAIRFRCGMLLAAVMAMPVLAWSTAGARADQWCGYATQKDAVVECGYVSSADCESAVGKGGMCFVDPDLAANAKRFTPLPTTAKATSHG